MIEPRPETLIALKEKFNEIQRRRASFAASVEGVGRRARIRKRGGLYFQGNRAEEYPPEVWARIMARFNQYLETAKIQGKNISTQARRQPYLMIAIRWELSDAQMRRDQYQKARRTAHQKGYYFGIMNRRVKQRMKGVSNGERGYDRA